MSKKTIFTTITPLPAGVSRQTVMDTLHDHLEMIDLNPSHDERHQIKPPPEASPEEYHCTWYQITDKVSFLPAVMYSGKVSFKACFHDLTNGLQTHCYAPMGLDIKEKWTLGGNLPHEPVQPVELGIGAPITGLYIREDVEIKCNLLMTRFVRKTLKQSLATLVARLLVKSQLQEASAINRRLTYTANSQFDQSQHFSPPNSPPLSPPLLTHSMSPPLSPLPTGSLNMDYPQHSPSSYTGEGTWYQQNLQQQQQQQLQQQQQQQQQPALHEMGNGKKQPGLAGYGPLEFPAAELPGSIEYKK
jgi:hypothetical protein